MAFDRGAASFVRLRVDGDQPALVDDKLLATLAEHRFRESDLGPPEEIEAGLTTGQHLYDVDFTYEKNGFGDRLLFAMRLDTHKVPSEITRAYRRINEQAARDQSATGFASKRELREARELAERQVREDVAAGKFRKSKTVPLLWDFKRRELLCGTTTQAAIDNAARLLHEAFGVKVGVISAGVRASEMLRAKGKGRDYEDLAPSKFTPPPAITARDADDEDDAPRGDLSTPIVPWVAKAVDLKDFLGNEALLWLWHHTETSDEPIETATDPVHVFLDRSLEMDCAWDAGGKQTLKGDGPTRLAEAGEALRTGKWPRKAGLTLSDGESQWSLTWQADKTHASAVQLPDVEEAQSPREVVDMRLQNLRKLLELLDGIYQTFLETRTSGRWPTVRSEITQWIRTRSARSGTTTAAAPAPAAAPMGI
ncbi:MAG: hypothetical protein ACOC3G_08715 [Phycisphaeraceae bacterium]